ncbi:MAG: hypothetical protein R3B81_06225 [bacterium]
MQADEEADREESVYSAAVRLGYESYTAFVEDFSSESDRAAVILGASRLDLGLRNLLQHVLLPNPSGRDELLDGEGPLSTFSARIHAAYRLGLITPEFARSLHLVRRIRNEFAHETASSSLDSGAHRDRVRELARPFIHQPGYVAYRDRGFSEFDAAAREFRALVANFVIRLDGAEDYMRPVVSPTAITEAPNRWSDGGGEAQRE